MCKQVTIGLGFISDWLRKWRKIFYPIRERSKAKPKQIEHYFLHSIENCSVRCTYYFAKCKLIHWFSLSRECPGHSAFNKKNSNSPKLPSVSSMTPVTLVWARTCAVQSLNSTLSLGELDSRVNLEKSVRAFNACEATVGSYSQM